MAALVEPTSGHTVTGTLDEIEQHTRQLSEPKCPPPSIDRPTAQATPRASSVGRITGGRRGGWGSAAPYVIARRSVRKTSCGLRRSDVLSSTGDQPDRLGRTGRIGIGRDLNSKGIEAAV